MNQIIDKKSYQKWFSGMELKFIPHANDEFLSDDK